MADLQSSLNAHLLTLGSRERLEIDGEWAPHTDLAFKRVCRVLGLQPQRRIRTFRLIVGATQQRTPAELDRAKADGAAYALRLRHHFAMQRAPSPAPANGTLSAAIRAHGGRYAKELVREAQRALVPLALPCAIVEKETGFQNVYGHDAVRNPVKSPPGGLLAVTHANYRE